jgi:hypothetical protein
MRSIVPDVKESKRKEDEEELLGPKRICFVQQFPPKDCYYKVTKERMYSLRWSKVGSVEIETNCCSVVKAN